MKTTNLLLALGCAAAFTACTVNDEPAVAPAMRTVTLSVEVAEPADTRVAYSTEDGETYKFAWSEGDKLCVFYEGGENPYEEFAIDKNSIKGKQATFTGSLPENVDNVFIVYSSQNLTYWYEDQFYVHFPGTEITSETSVANALAQNTLLYAYAEVESAGSLPDVKLQHGLAYLLLKSGLKVISGYVINSFEMWTERSEANIYLDHIENDYSASERIKVDSDGKLTSDYLIPLVFTETTDEELYFEEDDLEFSGTLGDVVQPLFTYKPGVIYEVAADNDKWSAIDLEDWFEDDEDWDDDDE